MIFSAQESEEKNLKQFYFMCGAKEIRAQSNSLDFTFCFF